MKVHVEGWGEKAIDCTPRCVDIKCQSAVDESRSHSRARWHTTDDFEMLVLISVVFFSPVDM